MVEKECYLFLGSDTLSKDAQLKKIKAKWLPAKSADFDFDALYAKELTLKSFQENILILPAKAKKRVILVRQIEAARPEIKKFILASLDELAKKIVFIFDIGENQPRDEFTRGLSRFCQSFSFGEVKLPDTFALNRQIEHRRADSALKLLAQLLESGEKPERIMGGLRYAWEKDLAGTPELKRRLKALLKCDLEIKTGRLKPDFALEKLVISLSVTRKP